MVPVRDGRPDTVDWKRGGRQRPAGCVDMSTDTLQLPPIFADRMILQQGMPITIWGHSLAGADVIAEVAGVSATARTDPNGGWRLALPAMSADGLSHTLTVRAGDASISFADVKIGEVWLCWGQSNMEIAIEECADLGAAAPTDNRPDIRQFRRDTWLPATTTQIGPISATGYWFARNLQAELNVPIGLLLAAFGGTRIERWTPPEAFEALLADPPDDPMADMGRANAEAPGGLFTDHVEPMCPYTIRGSIWYQGESNVANGNAYEYRYMLEALIAGTRARWDRPELPFGFVQLPNIVEDQSKGQDWPAIRNSILATYRRVPNTHMAVTIDAGGDLHPPNKRPIGRRLAMWALAKYHGRNAAYRSPLPASATARGRQVAIAFDHAGSGLATSDGGPATGFEVAGVAGTYHPASATIDGSTVIVATRAVRHPVAIRYAWSNNPACNLTAAEGLPASPFALEV